MAALPGRCLLYRYRLIHMCSLANQIVFLLGQLSRFLFGRHRIGGLNAATGNLGPDGIGQQVVFFVATLVQRIFTLNGAADPGQCGGLDYLQTFDSTLCSDSINGRISDLDAFFALVAVQRSRRWLMTIRRTQFHR